MIDIVVKIFADDVEVHLQITGVPTMLQLCKWAFKMCNWMACRLQLTVVSRVSSRFAETRFTEIRVRVSANRDWTAYYTSIYPNEI